MRKNIYIKEISSTRELKQFIQFPLYLYRGNKNYVPPLIFKERSTLDSRKNPAFEFCQAKYWLAYKNDKIAGRIAGIVNHKYVEKSNEKCGRFSWFDFIDDEQVAAALIETAENWAKHMGMVKIYGPYGFTNLDKHGMLVEGFDYLATSSSNYNFPYYPEIIEKFGYQRDTEFVEYSFNLPENVPQKIEQIAHIAMDRYNLRSGVVRNKKDMLKYKKGFFSLLNDVYSTFSSAVRLTEEQIELVMEGYYKFLDPDFVSFVLDKNDRVVAFGITMPSLSKALQKTKGRLFPTGFYPLWKALKKNDTLDLLLIGVNTEYQSKGANAIVISELVNSSIKRGIKYINVTQMQADNVKVLSQWKYFENSQLNKRFRCYNKNLT
ncbi:MAG: hypothetical protein NT175_05600 [Bacteroidetes bacterium]|nr:hypothetical protein [Bacteroidota bacterium]